MNMGAFGENFPYSNFHDLNLDWIVKIVKDFFDEYSKKYEDVYEEIKEKMTSDEEIQNAIEEYIEQHPIVNIPDYSIEIKKFVIGILGYVLPEMFGATGDGDTDDTEAFTEMFTFCEENTCNVYIPKGSYNISENIFADSKIDVKVNEEAEFPNKTIFYKTENKFNLSQLEYMGNLDEANISSNYSRYNEAICYDSKRNVIYSAYYQYEEAVNKTMIAVLDADTYEKIGTYQFSINPVQTISYNSVEDKIYVCSEDYNCVYVLDPEQIGSEPVEITLEDDSKILLFDEVKECAITLKYNANQYLRVNVYSPDLTELLYTNNIDIGDTPLSGINGSCANNGKVYQVAWYSAIEIDIISGAVNENKIFSQLELEGATAIGNNLLFSVGNLYTVSGNAPATMIYRFNPDIYPAKNKSYLQNMNLQSANTDLNTLLTEGTYSVYKNDNESHDYPTGTSKGILTVVPVFTRSGSGHEYLIQTFTDIEHNHTIWRRQVYVFSNTFTTWEEMPVIKKHHFSGTTDATFGFLSSGLSAEGIHAIGGIITSGSNLSCIISSASGEYRVQGQYGTDLTIAKNTNISGYIYYFDNL